MGDNYMRRLVSKVAPALLVLFLLAADVFALYAHAEALGSGRNVIGKISLGTLVISIDNEIVYDSARTQITPSLLLTPDSTMRFNLRWDVTGSGDDFRKGDYFSIPLVYVDNLRLTEPFTQTLKLDAGDGKKVAVAVGRFTYMDGLLAFEVVFNGNAAGYRIEGGPAGGYAELSLSSGQTVLPMTFADSQTVDIDIDTRPGGPAPGLPAYPTTLPKMHKALFSPDVKGGTVNLLTRYATMQLGDERKFGLDWRMTFFDLVPHFQKGGAATENVIIEDIAGEGQEFANFAFFAAGDRDKGFGPINDEDYEAPFFIEIPIVAVGSNRVYNLYGDDTLDADSENGYIGTLIRAGQLQEISGDNVSNRVRRRALSWGIEELDDGREKLIVNLGRLGPGVKKGEGLTADLVKEKDYPYAVLDGVIVQELLTAQRMIEAGGADAEDWKRVRKESLDTILYYWPGYRDKLCGIAGISAGSESKALEKALFAMTYEQLSQSRITTLGYDERRAGGIAGTMQIDSFVLRYRTVLSSVTDTDISNSIKVTTGILNKEDSAGYRHQFYAGIFGTVNVGEIAFIKADEADGRSGEATEETIRNIRGLAGAEFEVYEASGGSPLRFTRDGSVYDLQEDGDVTVLCSDADGAFKITGLSPSRDYALYERKAPEGYQLPEQRYTVFRVSSSASKYLIITNKKRPTTPVTPGSPGGPDSPGNPGGPGSPGSPGSPGGPGSPGSPGSPGGPDTPDTPDTYKPDTPDQTNTDQPGHPGRSDTPGTPGTPDTPETFDIPDTDTPLTDVPKSGDSRNIQLFIFLMSASVSVIAALLFESYRQSRRSGL